MLELRTLGAVGIHDGPTGLLAASPKPLALLVYLAVARPRGPQPRDTLLALFHPELDHRHARMALRQLTHALRAVVGADAVRSERQTLELDPGQLTCDVRVVEAALAEGDHAGAVAAYGGPFLSGFFLTGCPEFERWVEAERHRLARAYAGALERLALAADATGDTQRAVALWRQLTDVDPYATRVTVRLIAALEVAGDRAGALHVAEQHAQRLKEELEAEPAPDVEALARRLRLEPARHTPTRTGTTRERLTRAVAGRYRVSGVAGAGGMALVYRADDLKLGRPVALKVLRPELAAATGHERFLNEVDIAARLAHPNILPLHDAGEADGLLYYVMPYVEGESLRTRLARDGTLPLAEAVRITTEVADALAHAHERGIVHRDIKPANILLLADHAVVSDFGVARALGEATEERALLSTTGTPAYMSPEQAAGSPEVDGRSDLYSLGCVLHEMVTGMPPPFLPESPALPATPSPDPISPAGEPVPVAVKTALAIALAPNPADRFATAREFAAALTLPARPRARAGRRRVALLGAVTVAAVAAIAGWQYRRAAADPGPPAVDRPYTVLADMAGTADSATQAAIAFLLRTGLDASHIVQTVPAGEVERQLKLMDRPGTRPLDPQTARQMAQRLGVPTIVLPRLDWLGTGFVFTVRVEDVPSGQLRVEASGRAASEYAVVEVVDGVVRKLRRDLGESRAALANTAPLPEVLTSSLAALRKFQQASQALRANRHAEAAALYGQAVALDPAFAAARRGLGASLRNSGLRDSGLAEWRRALETPDRLDEVTRRDLEAWFRTWDDFALWDESLFRTGWRHNDAMRLNGMGYVDSALIIFMDNLRGMVLERRRFAPESPIIDLAQGQTARLASDMAWHSNRLAELEVLWDSLGLEQTPWWNFTRSVASAEWDRADSLRAAADPSWPSTVWTAWLDAARGRVHGRPTVRSSLWGLGGLILEVTYGEPRSDTVRALSGRGLDDVQAYAQHGVRAALEGDSLEVKRVLARFRAARDSATSALFEHAYEPLFALLEAELAILRRDWRAAAQRLAPSVNKLGRPGYGPSGWWNEHLWWILADVYTRLGRPDSAIAQLEAIVARPPRWAYSAAQFRLGQLHSQVGNREEALEHFTAFLGAFTDPDPEYRWMVDEARAEVGRWRTSP